MTQELLYSEGDLRFAVATAKTEIERLTAANAALAEEVADYAKENVVLTAERDEYQRAADKMAMEHKIERDGLGVQIDALAKDAARYRFIFAESVRVDPVCALVWKKGEVRNSSEWVNSTGSVWMSKELDSAITKESKT